MPLSKQAQERLAAKQAQERRNTESRRAVARPAAAPRRGYRPTFFHFLLALCAVFAGYVLWWSYEQRGARMFEGVGAPAAQAEAPKTVRVDAYTKKDGTVVKPHTREAPTK